MGAVSNAWLTTSVELWVKEPWRGGKLGQYPSSISKGDTNSIHSTLCHAQKQSGVYNVFETYPGVYSPARVPIVGFRSHIAQRPVQSQVSYIAASTTGGYGRQRRILTFVIFITRPDPQFENTVLSNVVHASWYMTLLTHHITNTFPYSFNERSLAKLLPIVMPQRRLLLFAKFGLSIRVWLVTFSCSTFIHSGFPVVC